jgi:hypothetical protein
MAAIAARHRICFIEFLPKGSDDRQAPRAVGYTYRLPTARRVDRAPNSTSDQAPGNSETGLGGKKPAPTGEFVSKP